MAATEHFQLEPVPIHVPDAVLDDLKARLRLTRWPDDAGNHDWYYGVSRSYLQELADYWLNQYDWRQAEAAINAIVPSLPGFGFSTPLPDHPDMNFWKVADLWHTSSEETRASRAGSTSRCVAVNQGTLNSSIPRPATT
ncbi:hypothetical protein FHR32_006342 [Streptosporangium album]|uniref:Epoxide hydrolase N-terminal domain-containing protein n=1 Tax=Streptosporangium album TaxID=47479 RepID=A0A7W7WCC7_9ACTN|nr:epoxide hydrolase N-terminal domain-containing protein [Streptosporangium album]MBB4941956.1 hypothetical protein [Streptosporangium album]